MRKKVALFLVKDFEEMEAIIPIDILRRAGIIVDTVSITSENIVESSRNIKIFSDKIINEINFDDYEMIILPGGPGTKNYYNSNILLENINKFSEDKKLAAICAAPTVFSKLGILNNIEAISYPSCEDEIVKGGAILKNENVVVYNNIITSKSAGTAIEFSLKIVEILLGKTKAIEVKNQIIFK